MKKYIFPLLLATLTLGACRTTTEPKETEPAVLLFDMGDEGSKYYRIPALVTASDGSLVAIADKRWDKLNDLPAHIDIVARRSEDNGKTWSDAIIVANGDSTKGYGDAAVVLDQKSNELICIFASGCGLWQSTPGNPIGIHISKSKDHGKTWSEPQEITDQIYGSKCNNPQTQNWYGAFAASGRALQLKDGRLLFAVAARTDSTWQLSNYACYSDDHGKTWHVSKNAAETQGDEAKIMELANGDLLMSIRNPQKGKRKFSISKDRGETWQKSYIHPELKDPACNGDILRYPIKDSKQTLLLHSIPYNDSIRQNVAILLSHDEGKTWVMGDTVCNNYSAYSSMTVLKDGSIGILYEEGKWDHNLPGEDGFRIWFKRYTLDELIR